MWGIHMPNQQILQIRNALLPYLDCNVQLLAYRDRNKKLIAHGILDGIYPDLFTVSVQREGYVERYSYTYCEILTKRVQIKPLCNSLALEG